MRILLLYLLIVPGVCFGAPFISDSGMVGKSIVITGTGFGTKSHSTPLFYDDFENGQAGSSLASSQDWIVEDSAIAEFSDVVLRPGSAMSAVSKKDYDAGQVGSFMTKKLPANKGKKMVSAWVYIDHKTLSTNSHAQLKLIRVGSTIHHSEYPIIGYEIFYHTDGSRFNQEYVLQKSSGATNLWGLNEVEGAWMRITIMVEESDPDVANGYLYGEILNGIQATSKEADGIITAETNDYGYLQWIKLGYTLVNADGMLVDTYWDDVYVDDSFSRVELCDGSTWTTRTHCEIQLPTAWSDVSITVTKNQGSFNDGEQEYLYVIDENGEVNQNGYPITIGNSSSTNPRSDVNQDNQVNTTDALLTLRKSLILDMSNTNWNNSSTETGDVNCDNTTNSTDAMLILRKSLGLDMGSTGWCVN